MELINYNHDSQLLLSLLGYVMILMKPVALVPQNRIFPLKKTNKTIKKILTELPSNNSKLHKIPRAYQFKL